MTNIHKELVSNSVPIPNVLSVYTFGWREFSQLACAQSVKAAVLGSVATALFIIQYDSIQLIQCPGLQ